VRVAVTIVRPGPASSATNGALELVVLTKTTCWARRPFSSGSKSDAAMSGPGMLNFAILPSNAPWPISTMNTTSWSFARFASAATPRSTSALVDFPVVRFGSSSGFSER